MSFFSFEIWVSFWFVGMMGFGVGGGLGLGMFFLVIGEVGFLVVMLVWVSFVFGVERSFVVLGWWL